MGKSPKQNTKTSYTSRGGLGGRVGRKTRNMMRRARRSGEMIDMNVLKGWMVSEQYWKELSGRRDQKSKDRAAKHYEEERIKMEAYKLYQIYKPAGCQYSACVQAIKTDWLVPFKDKWNKLLGEHSGGNWNNVRRQRR